MILGAQGYTIRMFMQQEADIRRSLRRVAEMGYKAVQISNIGAIDPKKLREICDENGLTIALTHMNEARILSDVEGVIREHEILGCRYVGIGGMPERYRAAPEWVPYFAEDFLPPARKIRDAGLQFMYHNHNFEFERLQDGRKIMDSLLTQFPADVMGFTLDTYWLQAAGCDICEWIERLHDRIPCVHFKDMTVAGMELRMAPVGEGNLPWEKIVKTLRACGKTEYVLVEQDTCQESPFVCLKKSYDFLAGMGLK